MKTKMKITLPFNTLCVFTIPLCHFVYAMDCPQAVYVELGNDGIINCHIFNNGDVYWYKGNSTKTSPVVRLENGQKEIPQESSPYDIDKEGSLVIKNMEEQYYGLYSVVNFYANDKLDTGQIRVQIAVKPQTPCPVIAGCNDCNHCDLTEPETGNISCSIAGARPQVHLNIVTDSENRINVIRNVSKQTYNTVTGTWDTTTFVEYYEWYDCTSPLHLRCVAGNEHPFELTDSVAHMISDSCVSTTQNTEYRTNVINEANGIGVFVVFIVTVTVLLLLFSILAVVFWKRRDICLKVEDNKQPDITLEEVSPFLKTVNQDSTVYFINNLEAEYNSRRKVISTPNGQCVPSDIIFKGMDFILTDVHFEKSTILCSNLMTKLFEKEERFVFISDGDFGRKAFVQYVCSKSDMNMYIIFHLDLSGLSTDILIIDAIDKKLNKDEQISKDFIKKIIETQRCVFVLDEIIQPSVFQVEQGQDPKCLDTWEITINDLLISNISRRFKHVRCLLCFNNTSNMDSVITGPKVIIRLASPSANLKAYVTNIFKYYQSLKAETTGEQNDLQKEKFYSVNSELKAVSEKKDTENDFVCVTKIIEDKKSMVKEVKLSPPLLILFIHIIAAHGESEGTDDLQCHLNRLSYLTRSVLYCLKVEYTYSQGETESFEQLKENLGHACYKRIEKDTPLQEKFELISTYTRAELEKRIGGSQFFTALYVGILKLKQNSKSSFDTNEKCNFLPHDSIVVFCHAYIQEYLAAHAISVDEATFRQNVKSVCLSKDKRMERVIRYIYASKTELRPVLSAHLMEESKWNILIDCLFESDNDDDFRIIKSKFSSWRKRYSVSIEDMNNDCHRMAVSRFCTSLTKNNVSLQALSFRKSCESLCHLEIPKVKHLCFIEMKFCDANGFSSFMQAASGKSVTESIQFINCQIPDELPKVDLQPSDEKGGSTTIRTPKILRTNATTKIVFDFINVTEWERLNLYRGCWEKENFSLRDLEFDGRKTNTSKYGDVA